MPKDYFIDSDDEAMYLEMLEDMDFETAENIYTDIQNEEVTSRSLASKTRGKTFKDLTYRNLRYIILGCKYCGAELRVKALATFIYRASLPTRLNALVSNEHLQRLLFDNMQKAMPTIYEWSKVKYTD